MTAVFAFYLLALAVAAAALALVLRLLPDDLFVARVTARSNHTHKVRQAGGLVVAPAALLLPFTVPLFGGPAAPVPFILAAGLVLFVLGVRDDLGEVAAPVKLVVHLVAAALALYPFLAAGVIPGAVAGLVLFVLLLAYWINVANFMDGIDLMEAVGLGLPTLFLSVGILRVDPTNAVAWTGVALGGALTAFAGFNRPPARLFLGDSGALVCGLVSGLVVFEAARFGGLPAALLPVLYFAVDATSTLGLRVWRKENLFEAHSGHAYQLARRAGAMPGTVVLRVGVLGLVLCALSYAATLGPDWLDWTILVFGVILTGLVVLRFRMIPAGAAAQ